MKIPGLSFSWKRAVGISALKQKLSRAIGIPMTKQGLERKIGGSILKALMGKKVKQCRQLFKFYQISKLWTNKDYGILLRLPHIAELCNLNKNDGQNPSFSQFIDIMFWNVGTFIYICSLSLTNGENKTLTQSVSTFPPSYQTQTLWFLIGGQ